ncbi:restriction endonuclease subunit M [Modestobacter caceresii]|uniref:site-specific DNA-methyltransferase (adenine-specific) n=1 Tax=Modestobacter caceresii TaxID=1522368 RepID=A0A098YFS3_9ACTN|nr:class I SAM-dependent DNA methyltransferase [Modestobacter caceresii]KGH48636.1 restriction endonuclease subunit M [Modestobacter caceresii]
MEGFADKVGFIWSIADLLRGDYKQSEYGKVILPLTVLRRLDCVLEPTKDAVVAKAAALAGRIDNVDPVLRRTSGQSFYNVSPLTFGKLRDDSENVAANLTAYIAGFSLGSLEAITRFGFDDQIKRLDEAGLLYQVVARFADVDLHPDAVSNLAMGYLFEELIRRFSEQSNETAGEHFTPREVIRLMVNLVFAEDSDALAVPGAVRTLYDPACGTGGMLSVAEAYLRELNPDARLEVFGQELNAETWAICRSDMMLKGQDPTHIHFGNSFTADGEPDGRFDYMLANPPFGVEWKKIEKAVRDEHETKMLRGRFGAGLPRINDGSLLFLQHMISKMKPVEAGGSRLAIVFNGSPLFTGAAGSGESDIRRWILENDWLEAIVGLPDQLFYNTPITTYVWVLSNRKPDDRVGKVVLIDARDQWVKMPKSLGEKRKAISEEQVATITRWFTDALPLADGDPHVKVFEATDFGYQRITVDQPLRLRYEVSEVTVAAALASRPVTKLPVDDANAPVDQTRLQRALESLSGLAGIDRADVEKQLKKAAAAQAVGLSPALTKTVVDSLAVSDPDAPIVTDRKGNPLADPDARDYENVPLSDSIAGYLQREVTPHAPDAWADLSKTKIGYEIPFTRHFFRYVEPRPVTEIDADLRLAEEKIQRLLSRVAR